MGEEEADRPLIGSIGRDSGDLTEIGGIRRIRQGVAATRASGPTTRGGVCAGGGGTALARFGREAIAISPTRERLFPEPKGTDGRGGHPPIVDRTTGLSLRVNRRDW